MRLAWCATALYWTGLIPAVLFIKRRVLRSHGVYILSYHNVVAEQAARQDRWNDATPRDWFRAHLALVADRFAIVSLDEALQLLSGAPLQRDYLVITFDDGYRDNYEHAWPLLREFGCPATTFLIASMTGTDAIPRHDAAKGRAGASFSLLTWDQAREMSRGGVSFGSHTMSHTILPGRDPDETLDDLIRSKALIARHLGGDCRFFAFPNGDFTPATAELVARAGYRGACTQEYGINHVGCDLFRLKRIAVGRTPLPVLALKLTGVLSPLYGARRLWRTRGRLGSGRTPRRSAAELGTTL